MLSAARISFETGEWKVSTKAEGSATPIDILLCLNDETWIQAFSRGSMCKIQDFSSTSKGIHYTMDCSAPTAKFKGPVDLVFDGLEQMAGTATLQVTAQGKTATSTSTIDYRWKAADCSSADVNMRSKSGKLRSQQI